MRNDNFILITSARDEEEYIEECLRAVLNQTALPLEWVIIDDASEDETLDILTSYAQKIPFINLISLKNTSDRNFGSKALAVNYAYSKRKTQNFGFVGVLDADVSLQKDYYEKILLRFRSDPLLGIGGGQQVDCYQGELIKRKYSFNWSVSGAVQFFRRECFEGINGYMPLPHGGIDAIAEVMARMNGWKVQTFPDLHFYHHGANRVSLRSSLLVNYRIGIREYAYGTHPLFQIGKALSRIGSKPFFIGTLSRLLGFFYAYLSNIEIAVPHEVKKQIRQEQIKRLSLLNR